MARRHSGCGQCLVCFVGVLSVYPDSESENSRAETAANMNPKYRKPLPARLSKHAPMFGLSEIAFPSFELQHGWNRVRSCT